MSSQLLGDLIKWASEGTVELVSNWMNSSNRSEALPLPFFKPTPYRDKMTTRTLSLLSVEGLRSLDRVSKFFEPFINDECDARCNNQNFHPANPHGVSHKHLLLQLFPTAIGSDFYLANFGDVGLVPKIPQKLIEMARKKDPFGNGEEWIRNNYRLLLIPKLIKMEVDADSPLMLDERTAVNGKEARLIEDPVNAPKEARTIEIPVTLNNILMLFTQKHLKHNFFEGLSEGALQNVLEQYGDMGVEMSHWSFQRKNPIGPGQEELAKDQGLKIVSLRDRILFLLLNAMDTGKIPQCRIERTSTSLIDDSNEQASILCQPSGSLFSLQLLGNCYGACSVVEASSE